jgi:hypothetical protein
MALVLLVGVAFAALRNANGLWASATFTLAIMTVAVALAVAFTRTGEARASWAGFAAAGGICLFIWLSTSPTAVGSLNGPPRRLVFWALHEHLMPNINPEASRGGRPYIYYVQVSNSLETIFLGLVGAILVRFIVVKDKRPTG